MGQHGRSMVEQGTAWHGQGTSGQSGARQGGARHGTAWQSRVGRSGQDGAGILLT
jgi:hypothetical protein